jgi:HEAT repeat protein
MKSKTIGIGLATLALGSMALAWAVWPRPKPRTDPAAAPAIAASSDAAASLRSGDGDALRALHARLTVKLDAPPPPPGAAQAAEWSELLESSRVGFARFAAAGKVAIIETTAAILDRLAIEGVPAGSWAAALPPSHDIVRSGLTDPSPTVRTAALRAVGHLWVWSPGCGLTETEEQRIGEWKSGFYDEARKRLEDADMTTRLQAIACLGALPLDAQAAPAATPIDDPDFRVRLQVLTSFANRPRLLTEEAILPLLHDPVPDLRGLAERVLKARGLPADLIGLGQMVTHPRPEMRASAIPLLLRRDDIDPIVWLLRLSEDDDETVRLKAVESFAGRNAPEVIQRLREIAAADDSEAVRAAARKLAPSFPEGTTAALPPLPGSSRLTPRAN